MYSRIWFMFNNALGSLTYAMAMSRSHSNLWALGARASMISHSCCRFYLQLHAGATPPRAAPAWHSVAGNEAGPCKGGMVLLPRASFARGLLTELVEIVSDLHCSLPSFLPFLSHLRGQTCIWMWWLFQPPQFPSQASHMTNLLLLFPS